MNAMSKTTKQPSKERELTMPQDVDESGPIYCSAIRFVATSIEEEPQAASACQNNGGIPMQVRFVPDDRGGHIEFGDLVWRPERDR